MDFRSQLVERYSNPDISGHRMFERINIGPFSLSIQASESHYCYPRKIVDVQSYESWEVLPLAGDDNLHLENIPGMSQFAALQDDWGLLPYCKTEEVQQLVDALMDLATKPDSP